MSIATGLSIVLFAAATQGSTGPTEKEAEEAATEEAATEQSSAEETAEEENDEAETDDDSEGATIPSMNEWVFMPAIEVGLLWHADPNLALSAVFRTSIDYRFGRIRGGFTRLTYDAASPRFTQRDEANEQVLTANMSLHDVYLGGGYRFGPDRVQFVVGAHVGVQLTEVPELLSEPNEPLEIDTRLTAAGLGVVNTSLEVYLARRVALTFDVSGRARFKRLRGGSVFGLAATVGLATAI